MNDKKILQAILDKVKLVDEKVDAVKEEVISNGKRIDNLGKQLAFLENDVPTREEHDSLEK